MNLLELEEKQPPMTLDEFRRGLTKLFNDPSFVEPDCLIVRQEPYMTTQEILERDIKGLVLISETDSYWSIFSPTARRSGVVTCATMAKLTGLEGNCDDSWAFDDYMEHLIHSQIDQREQYETLYKSLTEIFDARKVFKITVSPNRYRYYIVGIDSPINGSNLMGIFAEAVET